MQLLRREKGAISLKAIVIILLLFAVIHIGVKLVPMYLDSERLKDEMAVKAELAQTLKDEEILSDLVKKAKELDLPLGPESFVIIRDEGNRRMKISTKWDVEVNFFWGAYIRTFHFEPAIAADYARHF
ncbi:MAG TPA: hypothetical protein VF903_00395 [Nitrospirota bacterium]